MLLFDLVNVLFRASGVDFEDLTPAVVQAFVVSVLEESSARDKDASEDEFDEDSDSDEADNESNLMFMISFSLFLTVIVDSLSLALGLSVSKFFASSMIGRFCWWFDDLK